LFEPFSYVQNRNLTSVPVGAKRYQMRRAIGGEAVKLEKKTGTYFFRTVCSHRSGNPGAEADAAKTSTSWANRNKRQANVSNPMTWISESEAGPGVSH